MTRTLRLTVALFVLAGCSRTDPAPRRANRPTALDDPRGAAAPRITHPEDVPTPPAAQVDAAGVAEPEASDGGAAGVEGDAGRTFEAPGVRVVVRTDRIVEVHTTDLWGGAFDQLFESCEFMRAAVPTLRRTLASDRIDVLVQACGAPVPGAPPPRLAGAPQRGGARPAAPARPNAPARPGARPAAPAR